ncbi:MAG: hypothetical protein ABIH70_00175 [Chloroflexota bacterium]
MNINVTVLHKEYEQRRPRYERLKGEATFILERCLQEQHIPLHDISSRIKPFESFIEKISRQESESPFDTILDICGVRVICLFLSDLRRIDELIESNFSVQTKDDKISAKPEDAFGYFSVHYVCTLPESCSGPRYDDLKRLKFEIQVRTIAMHAWATVSHYLDYKSPNAIPSSLRKDFNALSALFYLADSHFELFFRSSQEAREAAVGKAERLKDIESEEINLDTLSAYLQKTYPDRTHSEPRSISELIEELRAVGYERMSQLHSALQKSSNAFKAYEQKYPPLIPVNMHKEPRQEYVQSVLNKQYADVGVIRVSLLIADPVYLDSRKLSKRLRDRYNEFSCLVK